MKRLVAHDNEERGVPLFPSQNEAALSIGAYLRKRRTGRQQLKETPRRRRAFASQPPANPLGRKHSPPVQVHRSRTETSPALGTAARTGRTAVAGNVPTFPYRLRIDKTKKRLSEYTLPEELVYLGAVPPQVNSAPRPRTGAHIRSGRSGRSCRRCSRRQGAREPFRSEVRPVRAGLPASPVAAYWVPP